MNVFVVRQKPSQNRIVGVLSERSSSIKKKEKMSDGQKVVSFACPLHFKISYCHILFPYLLDSIYRRLFLDVLGSNCNCPQLNDNETDLIECFSIQTYVDDKDTIELMIQIETMLNIRRYRTKGGATVSGILHTLIFLKQKM